MSWINRIFYHDSVRLSLQIAAGVALVIAALATAPMIMSLV